MRLAKARIEPIPESSWDPELDRLREGLRREGLTGVNLIATLANHPALMRRFLVFGNHVLAKSSLPPRERELLILRTGYLCSSGYEWAHHVEIVTEAAIELDIRQIAIGPEAPGWADGDRHLLRAADQQVRNHFISDETWADLTQRWDQKQLMDIVFTIGQYTLVSMALNTLGIQLEAGVGRLPSELFVDGAFNGVPS
jgi:4-carboxymuconolactone decarboxylase